MDLQHALRTLVTSGGSDLHLKVPAQPITRVHGKLLPLPGSAPLTGEDTDRVFQELTAGDERRLREYAETGECDFSYAVDGLARFRVNAFRQRGSTSIVMRAIPERVRTIDELDLPPVVRRLAEEERGIILLTGTTGSGKSTTLAAMVDHMNRTMNKHVITIEDPIEFLHKDGGCIINQREVGADTDSFKQALRRALRQDPDVILVGELRDEETVHTALSAAETGHLVLSTVHTVDATETVNRLIDFYPPHQQQQARAMLAGTLKGVISQRLVPTPDGGGRVATCEVMTMTGRVRDMIMDPKQTGGLVEVVKEGEYYGMQTFDQALLKHVQAGRITVEDALHVSSSPHDFKLMAASEGVDVPGQRGFGSAPAGEPALPKHEPVAPPEPIVAAAPPTLEEALSGGGSVAPPGF